MFNIKGGTAKSGESLCRTCRYSAIRKADNGDEVIFCEYFHLPMRINRPTVECNDYVHANQPYLDQMKEEAHILRVNSSGQPLGFMPSKEYREKYGDVDIDGT